MRNTSDDCAHSYSLTQTSISKVIGGAQNLFHPAWETCPQITRLSPSVRRANRDGMRREGAMLKASLTPFSILLIGL